MVFPFVRATEQWISFASGCWWVRLCDRTCDRRRFHRGILRNATIHEPPKNGDKIVSKKHHKKKKQQQQQWQHSFKKNHQRIKIPFFGLELTISFSLDTHTDMCVAVIQWCPLCDARASAKAGLEAQSIVIHQERLGNRAIRFLAASVMEDPKIIAGQSAGFYVLIKTSPNFWGDIYIYTGWYWPTPLKNDGLRQLGWLFHSQLNGHS